MKRARFAFAVLTTLTLAFAGCGGDDDDDTAPGAAGKTNGAAGETSGTAGEGNGAGGEPSTGNLACDPDEDTTCQNATDCDFVVDGTARTAAQTCGKGECLSSSDENCARDCILAEVSMTSECASCYADFVACTIQNCLGPCLQDPNSAGCAECQVPKGCRSTFNTCSGLPE